DGSMVIKKGTWQDNQTAAVLSRKPTYRALDIVGVVDGDLYQLHLCWLGRGLDCAHPWGCSRIFWIENHKHLGEIAGDFSQQFKPFPGRRVVNVGKCGDLALRSRQIRNEAAFDRVGNVDEHNRYSASRLSQLQHDMRGLGEDYVGRHSEQFSCVGVHAPAVAAAKP